MTPRVTSYRSRSNRLATLLVVTLVVLAGCTGGGGGGDGGAGDGAASGGGGSGGGSGSSGDAGGEDSGDGAAGGSAEGGDGTDGFGEAYADYSSTLRDLGSYTATYRWSVDQEGTNSSEMAGSFEGVVRVDLESESASMVQTVGSPGDETTTMELFWPSGEDVVYTRYGSGEEVFYQQTPRDQSFLFLWADPLLGDQGAPVSGVDTSYGSLSDYRDAGIIDTPEGPRHKYVIDDLGTLAAAEKTSTQGTLTDLHIEVLVDEDRGILTDYVVESTIRDPEEGTTNVRFELTYRDVGSTTVTPPEWLDEATSMPGSMDYALARP